MTYNIVAADLNTGSINKILIVPFERNPDWSRDPVNNSANQYQITELLPGRGYNIKVIAKDAIGNENIEDIGLNYYGSTISNEGRAPILDIGSDSKFIVYYGNDFYMSENFSSYNSSEYRVTSSDLDL